MSSNKAGWIVKEGGRYKSWKKRWMVLETDALAYYKKEVRYFFVFTHFAAEDCLVAPADPGQFWHLSLGIPFLRLRPHVFPC